MYLLNYIHFILYVFILITTYILTYSIMFPYNVLTSILFGWSLYAMVTIGHDCMHQTFSPYSTLNQIISYVCLNGIVMPSHVWSIHRK